MYRGFPNPGEYARGPAPFVHPQHGPPMMGPRYGGPYGPPPNAPPPRHLPPGPCRSFLPAASNNEYIHSRSMGDHYINVRSYVII